jgi:hypothetical protein
MEVYKFKAQWSPQVKAITHGFAIIGLVILVVNTITGFSQSGILACLPVFLLLLITWGFHPSYYLLREEEIIIKRPFGNIRIPLSDIENLESLTKEEMGFPIRLFACGGLFGHYGLYNSKALGNYYMWCTNTNEMLMIVRKNKKVIIISPFKKDIFLQKSRQFLDGL